MCATFRSDLDLILIRMHTTSHAARPIRFTGVVEAVGEAVVGIAPGDEVSGSTERVFGRYVCIPQARIDNTQEEK